MRENIEQSISTEPKKSKESELTNEHPSDGIFKAYVEGNARFPQRFEGIKVFVTAAAFEETDLDWRKYFNSNFSQDQVDQLLKLMQRMHHKKNIDINVAEERMNRLWKQTKKNSQNLLEQCLQNFDPDSEFILMSNEDLANYMLNPENEHVVMKAKEVIIAVRNALKSEATGNLLKSWRNEFDLAKPENYGHGSDTWNLKGYNKKLITIIKSHIDEHNPKIPKNLVTAIF